MTFDRSGLISVSHGLHNQATLVLGLYLRIQVTAAQRDWDGFVAALKARIPAGIEESIDETMALQAIIHIAEHGDDAQCAALQKAIGMAQAALALADSPSSWHIFAVAGVLLALTGGSVSVGPAKVEINGLPGIVKEFAPGIGGWLKEQITPPPACGDADVDRRPPPKEDTPLPKPAIIAPATEGVSFEEAKALKAAFTEQYHGGKLSLPDLPVRGNAAPRSVAPLSGSAAIHGGYLLGAGITYRSRIGNQTRFGLAVRVHYFAPPDNGRTRILLKTNPLADAITAIDPRASIAYAGNVRALDASPESLRYYRQAHRNLPIGAEFSHPAGIRGSIGCFVRSSRFSNHLMIGSGHVVTNYTASGPGTHLQRPLDSLKGAMGDFSVVSSGLSTMAPSGPFNAIPLALDFALAELMPDCRHDRNAVPGQHGGHYMSKAVSIDADMLIGQQLRVRKIGAGSAITHGYVSSLEMDAYYLGPRLDLFHLSDQIEIRTLAGHKAFACPGDSGAPVLFEGGPYTNALAAMIVCGTARGGSEGFTFATDAKSVLTSLNVSLVQPQ